MMETETPKSASSRRSPSETASCAVGGVCVLCGACVDGWLVGHAHVGGAAWCGLTELAAPVGGARGEDDQGGDGREVDDAALVLADLGEEALRQVQGPEEVHLFLGDSLMGGRWICGQGSALANHYM